MELVNYTENSVIVVGKTYEHRTILKSIGGKWNPNLKHPSVKGWVFPISKRDEVAEIIRSKTELNNSITPTVYMKVIDYTDKSIVVIGESRLCKDILKTMGGVWNNNLNLTNGEKKGWVFPVSKKQQVCEFVKNVSKSQKLEKPAVIRLPCVSITQPKEDEEELSDNPKTYMYTDKNGCLVDIYESVEETSETITVNTTKVIHKKENNWRDVNTYLVPPQK